MLCRHVLCQMGVSHESFLTHFTHKVQYSANHELLESTRNAEPVFKKVIQHFSSHNLFVLVIWFIFSSLLDFAISDSEEDAIDVNDNQEVLEVAEDKKNSLKFMKMMCIFFLFFNYIRMLKQ